MVNHLLINIFTVYYLCFFNVLTNFCLFLYKDVFADVQLSDQEIEVLLKNQIEVLSILEQLELRLTKLIQCPKSAKDNVSAPQNQSKSTVQHVQKKYQKRSESEINSSIAKLTNVRFYLHI